MVKCLEVLRCDAGRGFESPLGKPATDKLSVRAAVNVIFFKSGIGKE